MARFRSGSAGIGEEMARWERKGAEGNEWEGGICKTCDKKVVETVEHLLIECEAYREVRSVGEESGRGGEEGPGVGGSRHPETDVGMAIS